MKNVIGKVVSTNINGKKSVRKKPVDSIKLIQDIGVDGDAHAEGGIRQVSLLALESIEKMVSLGIDVKPGDFAENITTQGLDLLSLSVGTKIIIGSAVCEISQHGKVCHTKCNIYKTVGDCVMPKEGVFCKVLTTGEVKPNDDILMGTL